MERLFKKRYFRSIGFKIAAISLFTIVLLFPTYAFISLTRQHRSMVKHVNNLEQIMRTNLRQQETSLTENLARTFQNAILGMDFSLLQNSVELIMKNNPRIVYGLIFHQSGLSLVKEFRADKFIDTDDLFVSRYVNVDKTTITDLDKGNEPVMEVYVPVMVGGKIWGQLIFGFSLADLNSKLMQVRTKMEKQKSDASWRALLTTIVFLVIALISALLAGRKVSKPMEELTRGAKNIGQGQLDWEIRLNTRDEIGILAQSFNQMARDIKHLLEVTEDKKRMEIELATAQTIQRFIIPRESPQIAGLQFSGVLKTSSEIGGDFFDYFSIGDNGRAGMVVGDVSGHGVAAGLVVAAIKSALLMEREQVTTVSRMMQDLNKVVYHIANQELLTTCFLGFYEARTRELTYANAGHNFPYMFVSQEKNLVELEESDFPLGLSLDTPFVQKKIKIDPNDLLVLYTDGIIESTNPSGEPYDYDRFEQCIRDNTHATAVDLRNILLNDALDFYQSKSIEDDITILVVKPVS